MCPRDGNPCTAETCSESAGGVCGVGTPPDVSVLVGESFFDATGAAAVGPACSGPVGTTGCETMQCDGMGLCRAQSVNPTPGMPFFTPGCRNLVGNHCARALCVDAALGRAVCTEYVDPDSSGCVFASCGPNAVGTCTPGFLTSEPALAGIPLGCRPPAGFCYLPDGSCVATGTTAGAGRDTDCLRCAPGNPYGYSLAPAGTPCDDNGPDTTCEPSSSCTATAQCVRVCNASLPECACDPT